MRRNRSRAFVRIVILAIVGFAIWLGARTPWRAAVAPPDVAEVAASCAPEPALPVPAHGSERAPAAILHASVREIVPAKDEFSPEDTGTVEVRFVDERGEPVAGVPASLALPPAAQTAGAQAAAKASDASGIVRWSGVLPGDGYRWKLDAELPFILAPPAEPAFDITTEGEIRSRRDRAPRRSGSFAVRAREVAAFVSSGYSNTIVRGAFPSLAIELEAVIKLSHFTEHDAPGGRLVSQIDEERFMRVASGAAFAFDGVRPGRKVLGGYWREAPENYFFLDALFELAPGEDRDLGIVEPVAGHSLDILVSLVGAGGAPLAPGDVFPGDEPVRVLLSIDSPAPAAREDRSGVMEAIAIPIAESVRLHGLPAGECRLWLGEGTDFPPEPRAGFEIEYPRLVAVDLPRSEPVVISLAVRRPLAHAFRAELPAGMRGVRVIAHLLHEAGGARTVTLRRERGEPRLDPERWCGELPLPPGHYRLVAHAEGTDEGGARMGAYAERELVVASERDAKSELVLGEGATLSARALTAGGDPASGKRLLFSIAPWSAAGRSLYGATTDSEGRFELYGLVPDVALVCGAAATIPIGGVEFPTEATLQLRE